MPDEPAVQAPAAVNKTGRRLVLRLILATVLLIAAVFGIRYYLHTREWAATDDAFIEGHVIPISAKVSGYVKTVAVDDNQMAPKGQLLVQIDPRDYEARVAQAKANLEAALARRDAAKANLDMIRRTSAASLEEASSGAQGAKSGVNTAQAQIDTARFQEQQKQAEVKVAEAGVEEARANEAAADAEATRTKLDWLRYKELQGTHAVTQQQVDNAEAAYQSAKARREAAHKAIAVAEAKVGSAQADEKVAAETLRQMESRLVQSKAQFSQAEAVVSGASIVAERLAVAQAQLETAAAEIKQNEAALKQAELDLSYTTIATPEAGRVTKKTVENGALVQPGQMLLAVVEPKVWVIANYKETQLTHMRVGQAAEIYVDAYPGTVFKGHVDSIQAGTGSRFSLLPPENATGNYVKVVQRVPVKIVFDDPPENQPLLAPGMSVVPEVKVK